MCRQLPVEVVFIAQRHVIYVSRAYDACVSFNSAYRNTVQTAQLNQDRVAGNVAQHEMTQSGYLEVIII